MKTSILTLALVSSLAVSTWSMDRESQEEQRAEEAIQNGNVAQTYNWTGLYIGFQGGYVRSSSDFTTMLDQRWNDFRDIANVLQDRSRHEFDEDGFGFGGCGGYDYEFGNHLVLGGAVTGRRLWDLHDSFHTGDFPIDDEGLFDVRSSFRTTYLVTAGPRIGYSCGRFLPYVTGGVAFGEVDASQKIFSNEFITHQSGRESDIKSGWTVGTGVQYAITKNLSLKWEYRYSDLGTLKFSTRGADTFREFGGWQSASLTEHSFNAGVVLTFH
jgi:outer membrane immunogenic protein